MSIIRDAIDRILTLAPPQLHQIGDDTYSTDSLYLVEPHINRPEVVTLTSLHGIVQAIRKEISRHTTPIFISVWKHDNVQVFTTYRADNMQRDTLYIAKPDLPERPAQWNDHENAVIMLRSQFIENEGSLYLLDLLSKYRDENGVQTDDNGVTQQVSVQKGIKMMDNAVIRPIVSLKPYRTFLEVEQPESEFLLRLEPGDAEHGRKPRIGIIEADGGMWKLQAKRNVAAYFRQHLAQLIEKGTVVVAE